MERIKNLVGQTFDRLTVVKRAGWFYEKNGMRRATWWCRCSCGRQELIEVVGSHLTSNKVRSCGCLRSDCRKKQNKYDLSGEYGVGYAPNLDSYGRDEFYFDKDDYNKIKNYSWHFDSNDYVRAYITNDIKDTMFVKMHQLVMDELDGSTIDHIHGKETRNDNRKSNLRIATTSDNIKNIGLRKNNTSGVTGVQWKPRDHIWEAWITVMYNKIYLGRFINFDDAVKARKEAEQKYFGEYSYDNSQAI